MKKRLLKLFQWTVRMHFWQTGRYFSARMLVFFVWKSESDKQNSTTFLPKIFNSSNASGHEECSFYNSVDKHSTKSRRFFAQCPKKMGRKLKADTSSQNNPISRWNAVLTTQSKNFRTKVKIFRSMSEQENVRFSSESFSAQLVPMYTWKAAFDNPVEEFVRKCRWFSAQHLKASSIFFSKGCYGNVESTFDNLVKNFSTKSRKQFDRGPKNI